ncbi:hypothetical protein [Microseira sp. BLCC-F43]|uniref:hypothetical protein n=1 Tax=Microseira sp. BLCC-F43 TaxID=3153602 RepID=UPI0035B98639
MSRQWQVQRKNRSNSSSPPVQKGVSWQRPFTDPVYDAPAPQQTPSVQAKRPNVDWSRVTVEAQSPAGVLTQINAPQTEQPQQGQTVQREQMQAEDELKTKQEAGTIQRLEMPQQEDEEKISPKMMVQRQPGKDGMAATANLEENSTTEKSAGNRSTTINDQPDKGLIQRVTTRDTEAKKRHREEQEALSQPRTDTRKRTRASQTASDSQPARNLLPSIPNFETTEDGKFLWYMDSKGPKRPSWGGVDEEIYESAKKQDNPQKQRTEYLCEKTNKYLPRKKDRKGNEDYLDIDHKLNWKEHIYNSLDMHEVSVEHHGQPIQIRAYLWEEVETVYRNKENLQLIAKSANRSKSGPKHFDSAVQEYVGIS